MEKYLFNYFLMVDNVFFLPLHTGADTILTTQLIIIFYVYFRIRIIHSTAEFILVILLGDQIQCSQKMF